MFVLGCSILGLYTEEGWLSCPLHKQIYLLWKEHLARSRLRQLQPLSKIAN